MLWNVLKEEVHATVALKFASGIGNNKGFLSYSEKKKIRTSHYPQQVSVLHSWRKHPLYIQLILKWRIRRIEILLSKRKFCLTIESLRYLRGWMKGEWMKHRQNAILGCFLQIMLSRNKSPILSLVSYLSTMLSSWSDSNSGHPISSQRELDCWNRGSDICDCSGVTHWPI